MQRVMLRHKSVTLFLCQHTANERQVSSGIGTVKLVSHNGMSRVTQVNSQLMFSSRKWHKTHLAITRPLSFK